MGKFTIEVFLEMLGENLEWATLLLSRHSQREGLKKEWTKQCMAIVTKSYSATRWSWVMGYFPNPYT